MNAFMWPEFSFSRLKILTKQLCANIFKVLILSFGCMYHQTQNVYKRGTCGIQQCNVIFKMLYINARYWYEEHERKTKRKSL